MENTFYRYKQMFSSRLHAREWSAQLTEVKIACKVLNRVLELGHPKSVAVAG